MDITAADLVAAQDAVEAAEAAASRAWGEISHAKRAVDEAESEYENLKWAAEDAAEEYHALLNKVREEGRAK